MRSIPKWSQSVFAAAQAYLPPEKLEGRRPFRYLIFGLQIDVNQGRDD